MAARLLSKHPLSRFVLLAGVAGVLLVGCAEGKRQSADEPETPAHVAAMQQVETQPVTELDQVHVSEQLLDTYRQTCASCHEQGVIGAPKTGDAAAWSPRMAQGIDVLIAHARDGFKAMPPAGLCYSCSDEDFAQLIRYMSTEK